MPDGDVGGADSVGGRSGRVYGGGCSPDGGFSSAGPEPGGEDGRRHHSGPRAKVAVAMLAYDGRDPRAASRLLSRTGKGMETNLYSKLGAGGEGGGMGALSATRSQNVGLMVGGEYSYPGLPSYRDEASGMGAAAIVGGSIVVAAILVVILLMVNPPMVLGIRRARPPSLPARAHLSRPPLPPQSPPASCTGSAPRASNSARSVRT